MAKLSQKFLDTKIEYPRFTYADIAECLQARNIEPTEELIEEIAEEIDAEFDAQQGVNWDTITLAITNVTDVA